MANVRIATDTRNSMLDAINTKLNAGSGAATIKIYTGTQPTNANTAIGAQVLLGTLTASDPAGAGSAAGVFTFSSITQDAAADATGTAAWARVQDSDANVIFDCDVGTSGTTIVLNTTSIVTGGPIQITAFTLTIPAA
jgi:hypothetical protein